MEEEREPLKPKADGSGIPIPNSPVKAGSTPRDYYYTWVQIHSYFFCFLFAFEQVFCGEFSIFRSARSMAGSCTPPFRSYLRIARSGPSAVGLDDGSSSDDDTPQVATVKSISKPKSIPRSVSLPSPVVCNSSWLFHYLTNIESVVLPTPYFSGRLWGIFGYIRQLACAK